MIYAFIEGDVVSFGSGCHHVIIMRLCEADQCLCLQVPLGQRQRPEEDSRRPDQRVVVWLQQFGHGGPLRPPALPPQTQTKGTSVQ